MNRFSEADSVTATLQGYADRGVFRGFSVSSARRGRSEYRFTWLTRQPMTVVFDPAPGVLSLRDLFPNVAGRRRMIAELNAEVAGRAARAIPAHKRLDRRRARLSSGVRHGHWWFSVSVRGRNHEYATRLAVNLVNELFLRLLENYPDYLMEQFGLSGE
jgi:hypothetical protein